MQKECKFAIFNFDECDQNLIDELVEFLDQNAQRIFDFFELQATKKVIVNIIPTKKEFDDFIRKSRNLSDEDKIPRWVIGTFADGVITYLSLNDFKNTSHACKGLEYYKKTILHEFVHFTNALFNALHNCPYTEKFLSEGIASYLSMQRDGKKIDFDYSIEEVLSTKRFNPSYDAWHLLTQYLVENYDKEFVLGLFKDNQQARKFVKKELFEKVKLNNKNNAEGNIKN